MNWNELSIQKKADLIKLYVANGITDLNTIKEHYNSFQDGGDTKKPRGYNISSKLMRFAQRQIDKDAALQDSDYEPDNGMPQATFLMNRKNQQKAFEQYGYTRLNDNNYGPVTNAVSKSPHKNIPVYQKYPDADVDKNDLVKIGTFLDNASLGDTEIYKGPQNSYLPDPAYFPVDVYIDKKTGKVYNQGWDFNDYHNTGKDYGTSRLKNLAGNILDRIGSPTVVTTGLQKNPYYPAEADNYIRDKSNNLVYYEVNPDTGEYEIMMKPVTVTAKRTNPVKPKTELRPASELNEEEFWDMMEANSRQNGGRLYQDGGPTNNKSDWAKAHETELSLQQLGWDNPDNKLHSDYAAKDDKGYYAGYNLKPVTVRPSVQQLLIDIGKNNPKAKGIVEYVDPDIVAENNTMGLKLWGALAGVKAPINYKKTLDYLSTPFSSTIKALAVNKNNFLKRAGWIADTSLNVLGSGDALLNVLNENGVTNTINAFSKGDYKEGVLSGIGDLWNISSIYGLKKYIPNKLPNVNIFRNRKLNKEWIRNKGYEPLVNDIRTAFIHQNEDFPELFRPARTALIKTNHNQGLNGVKMQFDDHNYILNGSKWYTPWKWDLRNIFYGSAENIPSYTLEPDVIRYHPLTFFTSPKSFQGITAHEINHSFARLYSKKGSLSEFSNAKKGYPFIANDDNVIDLSAFNKRAFKHNGSPEELQSDMRKWKHELNNDQRIPYNYMPTNQQEKYIDLAEEQYFINKDVLKKLLTDLSSYGYFQNGGSLGKVTPYGHKLQEGGNSVDAISGPDMEPVFQGGMLNPVVVRPYHDGSEWFNWWYNQRKDILTQNIKDDEGKLTSWLFPKRAGRQANKYIQSIPSRIDRLEEHNYDDISNASDKYKEWLVQQANWDFGKDDGMTPEKAAYRLGLFGSSTSPTNHFILYGMAGDKGTGVHEATHDIGPTAPLNLLREYKGYNGWTGKYKRQMNAEGVDFDSYLDSASEIRSRLNALRYMLNLDPKHKWSIKEIRELKNHPDYRKSELDLDRYNDDFLLYLFNEVANNSTNNTSSNIAANGGNLGKITPLGQWQYPGKVTTIPSNNITMKGVNYPVIGVSNTGDTKMMFPNLNYTFNGNYVTEYPINQ